MFEKPIFVVGGFNGEKAEPNSTEAVPLKKQKKLDKFWCVIGFLIAVGSLIFIFYPVCFRLMEGVCLSAKCRDQRNIDAKLMRDNLNAYEKIERLCSKETDIKELTKGISTQYKLRENQTAQEQQYPTDSKPREEIYYPRQLLVFPVTIRRGPKQQNETPYPNMLRIRREISNELNETSNMVDIISTPDDKTEVPYEYINLHGGTTSSCKFPNGLKTAEILCKMWRKSITCKSYCIYGNTFNEGIVRTHFCKYREDKWSQKFEECKPFVNCKLELATSGNIKCSDVETMKSPTCQIRCETQENKNGTDYYKTHDCNSGTWDPPLPSCVVPMGIPLVKAPKVTMHSDVLYP